MAVTDIVYMVGDDKDFVVQIPQTLNDPSDIVTESDTGQGRHILEIPLGTANIPLDIVVENDIPEVDIARPTIVLGQPRKVR